MTPTQRTLVQILAAIAVSTGCGDKEDDDSGSEVFEPETGPTDGLDTLDEDEYPECTGGGDTGFMGPCCVDIYCMAPADDACPEADSLSADTLTGQSLGSGSCLCEPAAGPYAVASKDGECCYTVGIQGCEGRPLLVDGSIRRAPVLRRSGWAARAA